MKTTDIIRETPIMPKILIHSKDYGVNVSKIIKRILKFAPRKAIINLKEISIMDKDPNSFGFASYTRSEQKIELYLNDIIGWQPWILKKTYIIPYLSIGLALGHEIDHHVHDINDHDRKEKIAQENAFNYIYPSLGFFKPFALLIRFLFSKKKH